jgi:hypothetical protein
MAYCSILDFQRILSQTLTTGSPNPITLNVPGKLNQLGRQLDLNNPNGNAVTTYNLDDVNFYIRQAEALIDAALSQQYLVPLKALTSLEMQLLYDINEYNDVLFTNRAYNLTPGDQLFLIDTSTGENEQVEVDDISGTEVTLLYPIQNNYSAAYTRILLVKFPDPIPYLAARFGCAMLYDKYAQAQSVPVKTEYGDMLRKEAIAELNNIREGRTILIGITRVGSRFVNSNLYDRYPLKNLFEQDSTRSDSNRG